MSSTSDALKNSALANPLSRLMAKDDEKAKEEIARPDIETSKPPGGDISGGANKYTYNPTKELLEEGLYTSGNIEVLQYQKLAVKNLINARLNKGLRKGITMKEVMRDALDAYLRKEFGEL